MTTQNYQPNQMQNGIPLPYYLQQHEITKNQVTNFSQIPNTTEIEQNEFETIPYGWIIYIVKQTINGIHRNRP